jgi:hypothetical protein
MVVLGCCSKQLQLKMHWDWAKKDKGELARVKQQLGQQLHHKKWMLGV